MPTQNKALLEAYAACPPSARIFYTLEIWQSSFAQAARVVANVGDDMVFGIEAGAPRDGGAMVTFIACPFMADYPEQREGQPPTSKIKIDNVNRELVPKIRAGARRPRIHPDPVSRISRHRSDRAGLWAGRVRAARCADGRSLADRDCDGAQPAEQAVSAVQQELRLYPVSEPAAVMGNPMSWFPVTRYNWRRSRLLKAESLVLSIAKREPLHYRLLALEVADKIRAFRDTRYPRRSVDEIERLGERV
jgi:hypothetical protein